MQLEPLKEEHVQSEPLKQEFRHYIYIQYIQYVISFSYIYTIQFATEIN